MCIGLGIDSYTFKYLGHKRGSVTLSRGAIIKMMPEWVVR